VPNVTGHHFYDVFCTKLLFDNKHSAATEEFFSVMHSCCFLTGLGLGLELIRGGVCMYSKYSLNTL